MLGSAVIDAHGRKALGGVTVRTPSGTERIDADVLAVSGGWNPNIALTCHHGDRPQWDAGLAAFVASCVPPGMAVAGAARGGFALSACLKEGAAAGAEAAAGLGFSLQRQHKAPGYAAPPAGRIDDQLVHLRAVRLIGRRVAVELHRSGKPPVLPGHEQRPAAIGDPGPHPVGPEGTAVGKAEGQHEADAGSGQNTAMQQRRQRLQML